jgi:hypothetical protein
MATRKNAKKKKRGRVKTHLDIGSDPPVLVGGGGSAYLWVSLDQDQHPVNPESDDPGVGIKPGAPVPHSRGKYACSKISNGPVKLYFFDGVSGEVQLTIPTAGKDTWYIRFA